MGRLDGQTAIVTGSVRGIGLGIARRVAADRCRIVVWDRDSAVVDPTSAGFTPALILPVDIADARSPRVPRSICPVAASPIEFGHVEI